MPISMFKSLCMHLTNKQKKLAFSMSDYKNKAISILASNMSFRTGCITYLWIREEQKHLKEEEEEEEEDDTAGELSCCASGANAQGGKHHSRSRF